MLVSPHLTLSTLLARPMAMFREILIRNESVLARNLTANSLERSFCQGR